jgi:TonB family protein
MLSPLTGIALVMGISALLFLYLTLAGKYSDWIHEVARIDPKRARRISIAILMVAAGIEGVARRFDRHERLAHPLDGGLKLIQSVRPIYPALAKQNRVQGEVRLSALIGKDGHVGELKLIAGNPLLVPAAMDAAKQWVYSPPTSAGRAVNVKTEIDLDFQVGSPTH